MSSFFYTRSSWHVHSVPSDCPFAKRWVQKILSTSYNVPLGIFMCFDCYRLGHHPRRYCKRNLDQGAQIMVNFDKLTAAKRRQVPHSSNKIAVTKDTYGTCPQAKLAALPVLSPTLTLAKESFIDEKKKFSTKQ